MSTSIIRVRKSNYFLADSFVMLRLISLVSTDASRIFVTVPRFNEGIPVTLGYVRSPRNQASNTMIQPYPDYSWHSSHGANCDFMTSVVRVAIDECHRLYVLDTGLIASTRKCPPQLLVFNLQNDKLIKRYKFPNTQYQDLSLFISPVRWQL